MSILYPDVLETQCGPSALGWRARNIREYSQAIGVEPKSLSRSVRRKFGQRKAAIIPKFLSVVARNACPRFEAIGIDERDVIHAAQSIVFHAPVPNCAIAEGHGQVIGVRDHGSSKGVFVILCMELIHASSRCPIATATTTLFSRRSQVVGQPPVMVPERHTIPNCEPDFSIDYPFQLDRAQRFSELGDKNPLHLDASFARTAGYSGPIIHGHCTFGIACHAVLETLAGLDPNQIASHHARFVSPIVPGDVVTIELWKSEKFVSFVGRIKDQDRKVIDNGRCYLRN